MILRLRRSTLFPYTTLFRSKILLARSRAILADMLGTFRCCPAKVRPSEGQRSKDIDRKSTRLNSSHTVISYADFCLKKKKNKRNGSAESGNIRHVKPGPDEE